MFTTNVINQITCILNISCSAHHFQHSGRCDSNRIFLINDIYVNRFTFRMELEEEYDSQYCKRYVLSSSIETWRRDVDVGRNYSILNTTNMKISISAKSRRHCEIMKNIQSGDLGERKRGTKQPQSNYVTDDMKLEMTVICRNHVDSKRSWNVQETIVRHPEYPRGEKENYQQVSGKTLLHDEKQKQKRCTSCQI